MTDIDKELEKWWEDFGATITKWVWRKLKGKKVDLDLVEKEEAEAKAALKTIIDYKLQMARLDELDNVAEFKDSNWAEKRAYPDWGTFYKKRRGVIKARIAALQKGEG